MIRRPRRSTPLLEEYCYQVKTCIEVGLDCLKSNRQERPTIHDIVSSLSKTETTIGDQRLQIGKFNQDIHEQSILPSKSSTIRSALSSGENNLINYIQGHAEASRSTGRRNYSEAKVMPFKEIELMTDGFSQERLLAEGGNGKVYKGICEDGQVLVVKVLSSKRALKSRKLDHFMAFENQYILRLAGYHHGAQSKVAEREEGYVRTDEVQRIYCFEYLPNGSLEQHISGVNSGMDWHTRYRIIKGTCMGLRHLHTEMRPPINHFNLKPSNILLDENMQPKIDDLIVPGISFGFISRMMDILSFSRRPLQRQVKIGSGEYMPPEFVENQVAARMKFDIYSLGAVMIEIMTGNKNSLGSLEMSSNEFFDEVCVNWKKRIQKTVKSTSVDGYCRQVRKCLQIALECVESDRHKRPDIATIIDKLEETEILIDSEPLDVHPQEICFVPSIKKKAMISCLLQLDNKGNDHLAFMLVASIPKRYLTKKPLCGILPPRCAYTLTLTIMPNKQPALSTSMSSDNIDFFTLKSIVLCRYDLQNVGRDHLTISNFFETSGKEVREVMLKVISCSHGPSPVDEETSSSEPTRPMVEIITMPEAREVSSIDVHPVEPWIMTTNQVRSLRVWNYNTMAMMNSLQLGEYEPVHAAKFIARENWLIAGGDTGVIHVYNYDQNRPVESFDAHSGCITMLAVHPTDPFVLSSCDDDDHLIKLWDWSKDWKCIQTFQGHTDKVAQVTFNPENNDSFASASWDGTVKIWSICSNNPSNIITLKLDGHGLCVDYFTRLNRQHIIVGCKDDKTAEIWELGMKECVYELEGHADHISAVKLHPNLPILITGSFDGTVHIWNSTTYKPENIIGFNLGAVSAFGCIEGSRRIVVGCHQGIATMEIPFALN